jgi:hypothetical protein
MVGDSIGKIRIKYLSMQHQLDSIYAEADTLADLQKTMIVAYPQLTKWEVICYSPLIREFTRCYETPFPLILATVGIESGWNPTLVSYAGCRGLGQISTGAAAEESKKLSISYKAGYTEWVEPLNLSILLNRFCSRYADSGKEFAVKSYVGGNGFKKTEAQNGKNAKYIKEYAQLVEREELKIKNILAEANKVSYIYRGILYERLIEFTEVSRSQRALVRRVQEQNPTRPSIPVDSIRRKGEMPIMFDETRNQFPPLIIGN